MTSITIFTEKINTPLQRFNQSGTYDFIVIEKSVTRKIFSCNLVNTSNDNYCLVITNLSGETRSFSTGSVGWDINSNDKITVSILLNTNNLIFNIPDDLIKGFL